MTTETSIESQKVSLLTDSNNKLTLQTQRKKMESQEEDQKRSNQILHHFLAEAKQKKQKTSTNLIVEAKCDLDEKRAFLEEVVCKKKME